MPEWIKCNIDVSFPINFNRVGIDICIKDKQRAFILVKTEWFTPKSNFQIG
jgi:hypothetical protein